MRVVRKSPPGLLDLIVLQCDAGYEKGWVASVKDDLRWLCVCSDFSHCLGFSVRQWSAFISESPMNVFSC